MNYTTKSRTVEAVQWDGNNDHEVISLGKGFVSIELSAADTSFKFMILKVDGVTTVSHINDWLVEEANGKLDFYSPRNFAKTFEVN